VVGGWSPFGDRSPAAGERHGDPEDLFEVQPTETKKLLLRPISDAWNALVTESTIVEAARNRGASVWTV